MMGWMPPLQSAAPVDPRNQLASMLKPAGGSPPVAEFTYVAPSLSTLPAPPPPMTDEMKERLYHNDQPSDTYNTTMRKPLDFGERAMDPSGTQRLNEANRIFQAPAEKTLRQQLEELVAGQGQGV